jgi:hypothetical protein
LRYADAGLHAGSRKVLRIGMARNGSLASDLPAIEETRKDALGSLSPGAADGLLQEVFGFERAAP